MNRRQKLRNWHGYAFRRVAAVLCQHGPESVLASRAALDNGGISPEPDERPAAWDAPPTGEELEQMAARASWAADDRFAADLI